MLSVTCCCWTPRKEFLVADKWLAGLLAAVFSLKFHAHNQWYNSHEHVVYMERTKSAKDSKMHFILPPLSRWLKDFKSPDFSMLRLHTCAPKNPCRHCVLCATASKTSHFHSCWYWRLFYLSGGRLWTHPCLSITTINTYLHIFLIKRSIGGWTPMACSNQSFYGHHTELSLNSLIILTGTHDH